MAKRVENMPDADVFTIPVIKKGDRFNGKLHWLEYIQKWPRVAAATALSSLMLMTINQAYWENANVKRDIWAFPQGQAGTHLAGGVKAGKPIFKGKKTTVISRGQYHKQKMAFKKQRNQMEKWHVATDPWIVTGKNWKTHVPYGKVLLPGLVGDPV